MAKCNEYCAASIKAFEDFTNLYRREKPVPLFPVPAERGAESDEVYREMCHELKFQLKLNQIVQVEF